MGNQNTKSLDRHDTTLLYQMSQGMDTLRRSVDKFPDGTRKFKNMLDSNEQKVHDVLRRSRKGSTRKKALDILRDLEDLKDKERSSVRESILDNGAVESSSIIAADVKKYDRNRQRDKSAEELTDIRRKLERLRKKVYGRESKEEAQQSRKEIDELMARLDRLNIPPKSKLEEYKNEYANVLKKYEKKLSESAEEAVHHDADGVIYSKIRPPSNRKSHPPNEQEERQRQHLEAQNEIAVIQAKVLSLQDECKKFNGLKDSPEYNELFQSLMKLWDQLGQINDEKLLVERDSIIGIISVTLKGLNRQCMQNTRNSLSKNKILSLTEVFHLQYQKIMNYLISGDIKEQDKVYAILADVHKGLHSMMVNNDECRLLTAKITPSIKRRPLTIYKSSEQLMETDIDRVYLQDEDSPGEQPALSASQSLKNNKSCPNFTRMAHESRQSEPISIKVVPVQNPPTFKPHVEEARFVAQSSTSKPTFENILENFNYESITLKYAVEAFESNDMEKYNELDERLIALLIEIESLKEKCSNEQEVLRNTIKQRVQATCLKLENKYKGSLEPTVQVHPAQEQMINIENIQARVEILKTQINESYSWDFDNPEFKILEAALASALVQLDLIEASDGNEQVQIARRDTITDVRQAIERLRAQRYKTLMAGTEV